MGTAKTIVLCLALTCACVTWADQPRIRLQVVPAVVYKVDDPGNTKTSSFVFDVAVVGSDNTALTPILATAELSSNGSTVERQEWTTKTISKIQGVHYRILPTTPAASPKRMFTLPEAFDLHFYFRAPQALAIDSAQIRVRVADSQGRQADQTLRIPVQYYQQKTALILPFRGLGVVGQDWITNGGHGGAHGGVYGSDFALDLRGLDNNYAEQRDDGDGNASAAGWGREIIAPAAGTVTYARNDVPNNARQGVAPEMNWYLALHDPILAYYGNCVIIDHGHSECSVMAHLQQGSVMVKVGDNVTAGQVIGKLGNSGDSFGPHLHFQFQAGPHLFHDQPLPFKFANLDDAQLCRGKFVQAK